MSSYQELKAKAEELMREAERVREREKSSALNDLFDRMKANGVTIDELLARFPHARRAARAASPGAAGGARRGSYSVREAQYKGPNGETWSGGPGRRPEWVRVAIAAGQDMESYRIRPAPAAPVEPQPQPQPQEQEREHESGAA